jgi:hypothetical protein
MCDLQHHGDDTMQHHGDDTMREAALLVHPLGHSGESTSAMPGDTVNIQYVVLLTPA